jgi:hypothetical protein
MTSSTLPPVPPDKSTAPASRPATSAELAKEHSDQRFDDRDRRASQDASMKNTRWWTIAGVIAIGMVLWLVFTR